MDEQTLAKQLDDVTYRNIRIGFRWAATLSLVFLLMLVTSIWLNDIKESALYVNRSWTQYSFQVIVYLTGITLYHPKTPPKGWRKIAILYALLFGISWALAVYHLAFIGKMWPSAEIASDLIMMVSLLGFYALRQAVYAAILPVLLVSSWANYAEAGHLLLLPIEKALASCIIVETGRRTLYRWFYKSIEKDHENQRLVKKLSDLATKDQLTNLYNRRFFEYEIDKHYHLAKRNNLPLSVILIDVDHFKHYNDSLGHPNGDLCLKRVARTLQRSLLRTSDSVSRYGGEEFIIILPNTHIDGAKKVADRINRNLRQEAIHHPSSSVSDFVTLSQGIATWKDQKGPEQLVQEADDQLYQAKEAGRNQYKAA
jgi:diguanylate cyclase (GGDEF)-like protein